ncbi:MAG: argininosuccinate lyase [Candidatus Micrarchaeota archaeon]|nr:argininosuccinate lyase [Candidatus Micrarchaeota archaeon]
MANKLWGGRFDKPASEEMYSFLSAENVALDNALVKYDIEGSLAHVCMLAKQGMLSKQEAGAILSALSAVKASAEDGKFALDPHLEDVHTNVEAAVTAITPEGKKMHTARSRNDQVSLDTRMYMRDAINSLSGGLLELQASLLELSKKDCIFPAYTHTQVAQPASLAFWCHAHHCGIERDLERLSQLYARVNTCPLGSGAVAGTTWNIDREYTAKLLGFGAPTANPMDSVGSRGELEAEMLSHLYLAMAHASKIATDVILLANKHLIILPDEYSTGSSMMPQKKNPDPFELARGKASRMLGLYVHAAGLLKSVPSGYNLDSQESKYALMAGVKTAEQTFSILAHALPKLEFDKGKIAAELEEGYACATELADLLTKKGVPFRSAHSVSGGIVRGCIAKKKFLSALSAAEVSAAAGVKIADAELKEAASVDKKARFASEYKIPAASAHAKALGARRKALEAAGKLLEKEVAALAK